MFPPLLPHETRHRSRTAVVGARRLLASLVILLLTWQTQSSGRAAPASSDWASINADASQRNANPAEKSITASNVLTLKVKWTAAIPDISYPVVAGGKVYVPVLAGSTVHARALDAATGKQLTSYTKGAAGGLLIAGGNLYLAGRSLSVLDPSSGDNVGEIKGPSTSSHATFAFPVADRKLIVSGYASDSHSVPNSIYAIDSTSAKVVWHSPSTNAQGAVSQGKVITRTSAGSVFYNESTGQTLAHQKALFSDWFGGDSLAYTVASVGGKDATIYAYDGTGKKTWSRAVGPKINAAGWPHAVDSHGIYVATLKPQQGVEALDPATGRIAWKRSMVGVQKLAAANELLFVLTSGIGQPLRLVVLHTDTGKPVGAITFSPGYYAFPTSNELMIASGMVFVRAVGPGNTAQLVALGPK